MSDTVKDNPRTLDRLDDTQAIIQAAREHAQPVTIDPTRNERQAFVVPAGSSLMVVEPDERALERPRRTTGVVTVEDLESFKKYIEQHYEATATTAWVDIDNNRVVGVLNDATGEQSAWRDHRAVLQLVRTPEWQRWLNLNGKIGEQETFARHIEESEPDIVSPDAAELLEIAQTFHASTTAEFRSGTRLQSGEVQFQYVEDTAATAGPNGELTIPRQFLLHISPFRGEPAVDVTALLRYRVRGGKLTIGYELVRPHEVEDAVMQHIVDDLRNSIDRVYTGAPAETCR